MSNTRAAKTQQQQQQEYSSSTSYSGISIFNSITAGYAAGICGVVVGHPLDSIKVLLQTGNHHPHHHSSSGAAGNNLGASSTTTMSAATVTTSKPPMSSLGVSAAGSTTTRSLSSSAAAAPAVISPTTATTTTTTATTRSLRALYAGMTGPLLAVGMIQSINFALYDSFRRILYSYQSPTTTNNDEYKSYLHHDSITNVAIASGLAGSAITILTNPLMIVKTKQQIMVWGFRQALVETMRQMPATTSSSSCGGGAKRQTGFATSSFKNFYVGFGPHFVSSTLGRSVYMSVYEVLKRTLMDQKKQSDDDTTTDRTIDTTTTHHHHRQPLLLSIQERMFCAAMAGMTCWALIFPLDVLQNQAYAQAIHNGGRTKRSIMELAQDMYHKSGGSLRPFFRGFGVTVLRAGPVAATVLPVYDLALEWLSSR